MMSRRTWFAIVVGVLSTITLGVAVALVANPRPAPVAAVAKTPVITLAASSTSSTITVVGLGSATATPDQASVSLGVAALRPSVRDAVNAVSADMSRLMGALRAQGVQDKDIQTVSVSIWQQNNCCPQTVAGYNASNQVVVTVHHLANVSPLIEAAVDAVGNEIQLGGVTLTVSDLNPQFKAARASAMADANARAQAWAGLAGHHVGGLIALSEIVSAPGAILCDACGKGAGGAGGAFQIQPGQTSVSITITAVYELLT